MEFRREDAANLTRCVQGLDWLRENLECNMRKVAVAAAVEASSKVHEVIEARLRTVELTQVSHGRTVKVLRWAVMTFVGALLIAAANQFVHFVP